MTSTAQNRLRLPPAAPLETSAAPPPRWPGLDWLRAAAALAVVALHAGIPYMTHPLPALEWSVRSIERSAVVDALCWAINGAVMPTFFLMGGSLAAGLWKRHPGKPFVLHRTRRLLAPLVLAFFIILPLDMYVWLIGWFTQGLIPWKKVLSIKLPSPLSEQFWGVAHLWYLECLWTLSIGAYAVMTIHSRFRANASQSPATASPGSHGRSPWALLALSGAGGLILACDPTFLIGFQQTWWAHPAAIAFYALFFTAGWHWPTANAPARIFSLSHDAAPSPNNSAVGEGRGEGPILSIHAPGSRTQYTQSFKPLAPTPRLLAALLLFPFLLSFIHQHVETPFTGLPLVGLTTLFAAYSALVSTALFALARSYRAPAVPKPVAFVAEASFWMYLVHHPLAGLTQLALLNIALPPSVKFALTLTTSIWLSLTTYAVLVRSTWIGRLLDGRGVSSAIPPVPEIAPLKEPLRRAA